MNRRNLLAASLPVLALGTPTLSAADQPKRDSIRVDIDGLLGGLTRQEGKGLVGASILAGGGELFLDTTNNKDAHQNLDNLAEKNLKFPGSSTILPPRLRVKGNLEFRQVKIIRGKTDEPASQGMWVLVVESLTILDNPLNSR